MSVRIQQETFDPGHELTVFTKQNQNAGAVVSFSGIVRDVDQGLDCLEIEHYPAMTQISLEDIENTAIERWDLDGCLIIHRFGILKPGEVIMMVGTAARHRAQAFQSAEFIMDFLKSRAPFWKKERSKNGDTWVDAKQDDEAALKRW